LAGATEAVTTTLSLLGGKSADWPLSDSQGCNEDEKRCCLHVGKVFFLVDPLLFLPK
jgi:hypothetical protein